jgi:hypothetical protein
MKKLPPIEVFDDIAIELGVDPSFIEKDWFAVKILRRQNRFNLLLHNSQVGKATALLIAFLR